MKKFLLLFVAILIVGCSSQDDKNNTNPESENSESNTETTTEDNNSVRFRNIDITTPNEQILVKGQAAASDNTFYFSLKFGEEVVIEEKKVTLDTNASGWGDFQLEIDIPQTPGTKEKLPILTFYVKDEAGEMINPNYIPVDMGK